MKRQIEILSNVLVEKHLNRNPRVLKFAGDDVLTVTYDRAVKIPRIISAEARQLGLNELSGRPYSS